MTVVILDHNSHSCNSYKYINFYLAEYLWYVMDLTHKRGGGGGQHFFPHFPWSFCYNIKTHVCEVWEQLPVECHDNLWLWIMVIWINTFRQHIYILLFFSYILRTVHYNEPHVALYRGGSRIMWKGGAGKFLDAAPKNNKIRLKGGPAEPGRHCLYILYKPISYGDLMQYYVWTDWIFPVNTAENTIIPYFTLSWGL